nr:hypothetical protein I308_01574 [Cryptococcus tetragattii IND107]
MSILIYRTAGGISAEMLLSTQTNMFASPKTNPPSPAGFGLACLFPYPTGKSMSSSKSMARRTISLEMVGHFG